MSSLSTEFRCVCGQLLFRGFLNESLVEIKCKRCKKINLVSGTGPEKVTETYFLLYDSDGNVVDVSSTNPTILGYTREELIGQRMGSVDLHTAGEPYSNFWDKAHLARFDPLVVETFHRHKNGEHICVHERVRFQKINDKHYALVSHEVVGKSNIFIHQPIVPTDKIDFSGPIAKINIEGFLTYVSTSLANELMYSSAHMLGKSFLHFCSEEAVTAFKRHFHLLLSSRKSFSVPKLKLITRDERALQYNLSFIATYHSDNSLNGFVVVDTPVLAIDVPENAE